MCLTQKAQSPAISVEQSRGAVVGFSCPGRKANQARPDGKLDLGDVTKKAVELPRPEDRRGAKGAGACGESQAEVVIDINSGRVVWARVLNGHPRLRVAVGQVVCRARFAPTNDVNGRARGVITYKARPCR